jgi:hypothetical protein
MPQIPEDPKTPPIVIYGSRVEMKLRGIENVKGGLEGIVNQLYGPEMTLTKIASSEWVHNAVMIRPGEIPKIRETVTLLPPAIEEGMKQAYNQELRDSAQLTQNVDKGFAHYMKYSKADQMVAASMQVSRGYQVEYGLGVYFRKTGRRRAGRRAVDSMCGMRMLPTEARRMQDTQGDVLFHGGMHALL